MYGLRVKPFLHAPELHERTKAAYREEADIGVVISLFPCDGSEEDPPTRGCVARVRMSLDAEHEIIRRSIYLFMRMSLISLDQFREGLISTLERLKPESRRIIEALLALWSQIRLSGQCEEVDLSWSYWYENEAEYQEATGYSVEAIEFRRLIIPILLAERRFMDGGSDN